MKSSRRFWYFNFLFFLSGAPALIYQVTWQRVLSLYFGVDIYSTTITVAAFMFGLGLGSLAGGQLADRSSRATRIYALAEFALSVFGAISLHVFSVVGQHMAGQPLGTVAWASFALLAFPTVLMGMTLPLICRVFVSDTAMGTSVARLYGLNTLGAAAGALAASYVLVGKLGLEGAVFAAAAMNLALGVLVWNLGNVANIAEPTPEKQPPQGISPGRMAVPRTFIAAVSFASGFTALGYEIVWYRVLTVILHGTVYVFGTILFIFLLGTGLGSLAARGSVDKPAPLSRFGRAQLILSGYVALVFILIGHFSNLPGLKHLIAASFFTSFHPSPELASGQINIFSIYSAADIPLWTILMAGIPTLMMGYGFPHLIRAAYSSSAAVGSSIAYVYFANIIGCTAGSLLIGLVFIEYLGSEQSLLALICLGAMTGLAAFNYGLSPLSSRKLLRVACLSTVAVVIIWLVFPQRGQVIKAIHLANFPDVQFVAGEDRTGVVALRTQQRVIAFAQEQRLAGVSRLYIDGAMQGQGDEAVEHPDPAVRLALARTPAPRRALSIGLGDGVMCATALADSSIKELVIVELNAVLWNVLNATARGKALTTSPRVRLVNDDGRRWLWAHPYEKFDLITMFPLHATHAYYGNLYSKEFFELAAAHLARDGMLVTRTVDLFSTPRTLIDVFNHVVRVDQHAYIASRSPLHFNEARLPFSSADFPAYVEADRDTIAANTAAAPINWDLRPNSEFYMTYRYAWPLASTASPEKMYSEGNKQRFSTLLVKSKAK